MASQSSDVEILVHVAAPSRTADDAVYRQFAQAYLSFQPHSRTNLEDAGPSTRSGQHACSSSQEFLAVPSSQAFIPESQDLSFSSAIGNRSSPPLRTRKNLKSPPKVEEPSSSQASSWCAPPSHISDSYPLPDVKILRGTPTRVLERYLKLPGSSSPCRPAKDRTASAKQPEINIPSSIPIPDSEPDSSQPLRHAIPRKIIPVTPIVPAGLVGKRQALELEDEPTVIDESHISSSAISYGSRGSSLRAESAPPASKRSKTISNDSSAVNLLRSSSDTGPARRQPTSSSSVVTRDFGDALEIRPPSPPVDIVDIQPPNLVSEKLAKLARDLSSRYRPKAKREIDPFERGYWLLDCTNWSDETRLEAWVFLANYLRSGLAGWGVWCRRDSSHDWIRLYCWGHVAKHTYLLLYLASGRHVKTTGAEWYDADGEVVLEVPPTERQT